RSRRRTSCGGRRRRWLGRRLGYDVDNARDAYSSGAPEGPCQDPAPGLGRGFFVHMTDSSSDAPKGSPSDGQPQTGHAQAGQAMWGGRFSDKPADLMQAINVSIAFDKRLAAQDLAGSRAHAAMLPKVGVITSGDASAILQGLEAIETEIVAGTFPFREEFEDIHMNVEARLRELIGPAAGRLHTARSRNDQVALDFRLWVRDACDRTIVQAKALQRALVAKAEPHAATLMPGFTHLQPAQDRKSTR